MSAELTPHQRLWQKLREHTEARIGLGHAGGSITTQHHLEFQYAHACAQDAVWRPLDWSAIKQRLAHIDAQLIEITSQAVDRHHYLQRPDLGRKLSIESVNTLSQLKATKTDLVIVIADGLSSSAIEQQAVEMVKALLDACKQRQLACPYVFLASQARVALGDPIAEQLGARHLVLMVGERPGLSSPNSLGIYYTYQAKQGYTDANRNCISNIRNGGQSVVEAAQRLMWLVEQAELRQFSGVELKDESQSDNSLISEAANNFLLPVKEK
jgi:ethanolamine ammonia-lyase small subunit